MLALIWAQARDSSGRAVIGAGGDIPWRIPEDFSRFRRLTMGHPVIMGANTWASLPKRPLPGRTNIVLVGDPARLGAQVAAPGGDAVVSGGDAAQPGKGVAVSDADSAVSARSVAEALALASATPGGEAAWVIGGGVVYPQFVNLADHLEITEVDRIVAGDVFAPELDPEHWFEPDVSDWRTSKAGPRYRFRTYRRRPVG